MILLVEDLVCFFGCAIVVIGAVVQATSKEIGQLMAGRFVLGLGVSFATAAAPIYAIEISHPSYRAAITGSYNTLYCWGSIMATVVLFCTQNFPTNKAWILPTYIQMLCPGIVVLFTWFIPESPRWLYTHGHEQKAKDILTYYHGEGDPDNAFITLQIREFEEQLELDGSDKRWWDYRALFVSRANVYRLGCNLVYSCFGQLSNGGISYFVGAFYHSAGIESNEVIFSYNLGTGFLSFVLALIGAQIIQQIGRRKVILSSLLGMALFWALVTVCVARFSVTGKTSWAKGGIAFYILFGVVYALGVTPMQALYPTEVLSYEMRAKGGAFGSLVINAVGLINQFATPVALQNIGWKTYLVWTIWCIVEAVIAYFFFVETKGFTLEELDDIFKASSPRKESTRKRAAAIDAEHNIIQIDTV